MTSFCQRWMSGVAGMNQSFVHLHVHTEYSLLDGAARIEQLVQRAKELGMSSLAITDHSAMYGVIPFYQICKKHGIHPIIGCELEIVDSLEKKYSRRKDGFHLVVLAETDEGYRNLLRLTTAAHFDDRVGIDKTILKKYAKGLIATSACLRGEIPQAILQDQFAKAKEKVAEYLSIFGQDHFFFELQNPQTPEQRKVNTQLVRWSQEWGVPLVATNDVHYVRKEDHLIHECLLCIQQGIKLEELESSRHHLHLTSAQEMEQIFSEVPEALDNTVRIAERCQVDLSFDQRLYPQFPLPKGTTAQQRLREKCMEGVQRRYQQVTKEVMERLEYELSVIDRMGYNDYFLIVWDLVQFAKNNQIGMGPGRGSVAGSLVAYVLEISEIDPLKYDLLFERFLNPERVSLPDIDLDFQDERRDEVIRYLRWKYGKDHVAQIVTFGTMAPRAAIRDVGRILGVSNTYVNQVAKLIPSQPGMSFEKALKMEPQLVNMLDHPPVQKLLNISMKMEGLPRHVSTHAAGIVLSQEPLIHDVPLQKGNDDLPLTQYAMEELEKIGLCKIDLLGLRNISVIQHAVQLIREGEKTQLDVHRLNFDDSTTYQLIASGNTIGVFQLESTGIRKVLRDLKPSTFEDVIAVLALYRPGPMEQIPKYIQVKSNPSLVELPHPDLADILQQTHGIIVYQEQIMQIASKMAGFSLGQADELRRAVAKKKKELLDEHRATFVEGCIRNGYKEEIGHQIYNYIVRFANYGFNRSHAVAYSMLAFQTAFLKAHYPLYYMTSLLTSVEEQPSKMEKYIQETKRMGIAILPPEIQKSHVHFSIEQNAIRCGLYAIKHIGKMAAQEILRARSKGSFRDLLDLWERVDHTICNRATFEALIQCGAMDSLPGHRKQKLAMVEELFRDRKMASRNQISLFREAEKTHYKHLVPYTKQEELALEKEYLGVYLSSHPFEGVQNRLLPFIKQSIKELVQSSQKRRVGIGGIIQRFQTNATKTGELMAFLRIEDSTGPLEIVLFPEIYRKLSTPLKEGMLVTVRGQWQGSKQRKVIASAIEPLKIATIWVRPAHENRITLQRLKDILMKSGGAIPVQLLYKRNDKGVALPLEKYGISSHPSVLRQIEALLGMGTVHIKEWW